MAYVHTYSGCESQTTAAAHAFFCIILITDGYRMTFVILHKVQYSLLEVLVLCNYILTYAQTPTVHTFENILSYRIIHILIFLKSVRLR